MVGLIPPVVLILMLTGYLTYRVSSHFIRISMERAAQAQVGSITRDIEQFLTQCGKDLAIIAQENLDEAKMRRFLASRRLLGGVTYREFAFISQKDETHIYLVAKKNVIQRVPSGTIEQIKPNPLTYYEQLKSLTENNVWISPITVVEHPFPVPENPNQKIVSRVIYFGTPYIPADRHQSGYLLLSVEVRDLRNLMSQFNSQEPQHSNTRYSYVFNQEGWMLFESVDPRKPEADLSTDLARRGYTGTLGSPGLPAGFRPDPLFGNFWKMVDDVRQGKSGMIQGGRPEIQSPDTGERIVAYSPLRFSPGNPSQSVTLGGVAFIDNSRLPQDAGYRQMDMMFIITLVTALLVSLMIFLLGHIVTRPIFELTRAVDRIRQTGNLETVDLPYSGYEISLLQESINSMISRVKQQMEEIETRDREMAIAALREKAPIEQERMLAGSSPGEISGIVGGGTIIEKLKSEIMKAAQADVDVLIIGETGTGKQLTAEAIHRHSTRCKRPFVCINCGELDENLLLDTLFGHVKGAFTEAKTERKGAFLEATGGILFLDEIQTASAGVQQALLRAVSQRRIKPLGSDRDVQVDVRLIAATNADLPALVDQGKFRQDLYFRLKVLTLHTPPLREMKENVPILIRHYFLNAKEKAGKPEVSLSRGAVEKMKQYSWPGNVRELINCITRAVVMAEGDRIYAEDLRLEGEKSAGTSDSSVAPVRNSGSEKELSDPPGEEASFPVSLPVPLNSRQEKAYHHVLKRGSITRTEYQRAVGGLPARTALYDLQDMVRKQLLIKIGQGPATRYVLPDSFTKPGA